MWLANCDLVDAAQQWGFKLDFQDFALGRFAQCFSRQNENNLTDTPFPRCITLGPCCFTCYLCSFALALWPLVQFPHQSKDNSTLLLLHSKAATHSILFYRKWASSWYDTILNFPAHFLTLPLSSLSACRRCSLHPSFSAWYITAGNPLCGEDSAGGIQTETCFQNYSMCGRLICNHIQIYLLRCVDCMQKEHKWSNV